MNDFCAFPACYKIDIQSRKVQSRTVRAHHLVSDKSEWNVVKPFQIHSHTLRYSLEMRARKPIWHMFQPWQIIDEECARL